MDSSKRPDRYHWVVERTGSWMLAFRYDRSAVTITAVTALAITIIGVRRLPRQE